MNNHNDDHGLGKYTDKQLMEEIALRRARAAPMDLWDFEEMLEASQSRDGLSTYEAYFESKSEIFGEGSRPCPRCGNLVGVRARHRSRRLRTMSGEVTLQRNYHYCESCKHGFCPLDAELGLEPEGELTPKLSVRLLDFALHSPFEEAAQRWKVHHDVEVSENLLRLVTERAGRKVEALGIEEMQRRLRAEPLHPARTLVVEIDGSHLPMRGKEVWKEAKLCVVYRGENHLPGSEGKRGTISESRYSATLRPVEEFRKHVDNLLKIERAEEAQTVAWLGDGAPMNWNIADELCPKAVQILDWAHAVEHGAKCGKVLLGENSPWVKTWTDTISRRLADGDVKNILSEIKQCRLMSKGESREALDALQRYYVTHSERMRYKEFRERGFPIGSGVVESAHRHVLQKRMKLAGQHWDPVRADRMAKLRSAYKTAGPCGFFEVMRCAA